MKLNKLRILFLVGCAVVVLPVFLCGCDSQKEGDPKDDSAASRPSPRDTNTPAAGGCTFSSDLRLEVCVRREIGGDWERIGITPSSKPINIPHGVLWAVNSRGRPVDMNALAREIATKKIPGLWLEGFATDADLMCLKGLTGLQTLDLSHTKITDAGLTHLKGLTGLQTLDLSHTKITHTGLTHLKGLTGLQTLNLSWSRVTNAGLANLKGLTGLQELDLSGPYITSDPFISDAGLTHLKGLTGLQTLKLSWSSVTDAGLANLKGLSGLQELDLSRTYITDAGLSHLEGLPELQELDLSGTKITDAGLAHLEDLTGLKTLKLENTYITSEGLVCLKGLTGLRSLDLSGPYITDITDAGLVYLKGLTGLQKLDLLGTKITDAGLAHLRGLPELQELDLSRTKITDAGLAHLKGLTGLQELDLSGTKITDAGLAHLKDLTGLQRLYLADTKITDAELSTDKVAKHVIKVEPPIISLVRKDSDPAIIDFLPVSQRKLEPADNAKTEKKPSPSIIVSGNEVRFIGADGKEIKKLQPPPDFIANGCMLGVGRFGKAATYGLSSLHAHRVPYDIVIAWATGQKRLRRKGSTIYGKTVITDHDSASQYLVVRSVDGMRGRMGPWRTEVFRDDGEIEWEFPEGRCSSVSVRGDLAIAVYFNKWHQSTVRTANRKTGRTTKLGVPMSLNRVEFLADRSPMVIVGGSSIALVDADGEHALWTAVARRQGADYEEGQLYNYEPISVVGGTLSMVTIKKIGDKGSCQVSLYSFDVKTGAVVGMTPLFEKKRGPQFGKPLVSRTPMTNGERITIGNREYEVLGGPSRQVADDIPKGIKKKE